MLLLEHSNAVAGLELLSHNSNAVVLISESVSNSVAQPQGHGPVVVLELFAITGAQKNN